MGEEHNRRWWCFHCLQRRIGADFSDKLAFSYGVSDSGFPFGSTAIIQIPFSGRDVSADFELVYLPCHEHKCLTKFVDEYLIEKPECNGCDETNEITSSAVNQDHGDACPGFSSDKAKFVPALVDCHCLSNGYKKFALYGMGYKFSNCGCNYCGWFSCSRTMAALAPVAHVTTPSYSRFEDLVSNFLSGSVEDHVLNSLSLLIEGKAAGRDSLNFLNLIGIPSFSENNLPGCLRHPNIVPVLGMLKSSDYVNLVFPKTPFTLENVLNYSPNALKSEWQIKFLIYQLLSALSCIHGLGVAHGNVCPSNVKLSDSCWLWLRICDKPQLNREHINISPSRISCCTQGCPSQGLYADLKLSSSIDWHSAFNQWWKGELSNFEYLLILNKLAGRRWGDHSFHVVMPWVIDFSTKPDPNSEAGWRDLSKSKWRLAKGDEQLDFTYSTSEIPHHVSDECLSELAVCSYKARRLPLSVLRMAVRSVYEPNEYPLTMQRLYQWTPDECIPEFYCDPQIFSSVHSGMTDLAVPTWAGNPEEFIKMHRYALESDRVSLQIHQWIDITFGYKMSGQAAVAAKNVMLPSSEPTMIRSQGRCQLFNQPHPVRLSVTKKISCANELIIDQCHIDKVENKNLLPETAYLQELENVSAFCEHTAHLSPLYCYLENCGKDISLIEEQPSECFKNSISSMPDTGNSNVVSSDVNINNFLEYIEVDDDASIAYQELLLWIQKLSFSRIPSKYLARDIFSVGCILAELHLRRPLFNSITLEMYLKSGVAPALLQELPPHTKVVVEACIRKDCRRRPSVHCLLESPYFPATVRSAYLFLAPLQLLAKEGSRLCYAANFAKQGGLKAMGPFAAEMCAPYCLPLLLTLSDTDAELAYTLLSEFLKCLKPKAVRKLIISIIRKILQATCYSHLKVSLLQDSFVRELWKRVGKQFYLEKIHPLVLANLCSSLYKSSAAAASVLLIGSSEELGVPVTVHQTILPLIQCFGKGLCTEGIDALVVFLGRTLSLDRFYHC